MSIQYATWKLNGVLKISTADKTQAWMMMSYIGFAIEMDVVANGEAFSMSGDQERLVVSFPSIRTARRILPLIRADSFNAAFPGKRLPPTHREPPTKARDYRTREDSFEGVWSQLLSWIEKEPDATDKTLFARLQELHPGRFPDGQLRTLQRRIRQWRHM